MMQVGLQRTKPFAFAVALGVAVLALGFFPSNALAADNDATGDIGGDATDLTDSNTFTLNSTTLALVKTAFLTDGTQLTSGATIPKGTLVQFMVYIDNSTAIAVDDVNVQDVLDVAFTYQAGTIKVDNSQNTGATEAAIYAAVNATAALDDAVDGVDEAGISGTTISAGSGAGNAQLDIAGSKVWAMLFTVEMQ